jgi:hypothetical protein
MSDRRSDTFERALDDARREGRTDDDTEPTRRPRVGVGVPLGAAPGSAGKARFGLALDWTDELTDRPAPPLRPLRQEATERSGDMSDEIATELGLGAPQTLDQLLSRWRAFVWRNHPDRHPLEMRERANARMAIANALYDEGRRQIRRAR